MEAVAELLAKQAITEVLYRYCRAMDRMDREMALACWHPDGTADYEDVYSGPGHGFVDWVWPVHREGFVAHSHQITNVLVDVRGDRAVSEAYVTVALRSAPEGGTPVDIVGRGRYLDRWSSRAGVWALDHRHHLTDLQTFQAVSGGPGGSPTHHGRRDRDDLSYQLLGGRA